MTIVARMIAVAGLVCACVASPAHAACAFGRMPVEVGMPRLELEMRVAAVLGKSNAYSPYGNNLAGGAVVYRSGRCALRVTFAAGAPAPRVAVAGGGSVHLQPIDETVLGYKVILVSRPPRR